MTQAFDRCLAPTGLRITQFALLNRLARSGPRSIQALAQEMGLDRTTLGRNLRPLERDGLVTIGIDPQRPPRPRAADHAAGRGQAAGGAALLDRRRRRASRETYGAEQTQALHATLDAVASLDLGVSRLNADFLALRLRAGVTSRHGAENLCRGQRQAANGGKTCPT